MANNKELNSNQKAIIKQLEEMIESMKENGFICDHLFMNQSVMFFANKNYGEVTFDLNDGISVKAKLY